MPPNGRMAQDTVLAVLVLLRQHMDESAVPDANTVRRYANWAVHTSLDKSVPSLLDAASNVLSDDTADINDRMVDLMAAAELRREMLALLGEGEAAARFRSLRFWRWFYNDLVLWVLDKPLVRVAQPQKNARRYVDRLTLTVPRLSELDPEYLNAYGIEEGAIFWEAVVGPICYTAMGPLCWTETPEAFGSP